MPESTRKPPSPPRTLGTAGRALWRDLHDDLDFDPHERVLVTQACKQADLVDQLEQVISSDGLTITGSAGQPRLHGAVTELRQCRLALGRLIAMLNIPSGEEQLTPAQIRGRNAAEARYARLRGPRGAA